MGPCGKEDPSDRICKYLSHPSVFDKIQNVVEVKILTTKLFYRYYLSIYVCCTKKYGKRLKTRENFLQLVFSVQLVFFDIEKK